METNNVTLYYKKSPTSSVRLHKKKALIPEALEPFKTILKELDYQPSALLTAEVLRGPKEPLSSA